LSLLTKEGRQYPKRDGVNLRDKPLKIPLSPPFSKGETGWGWDGMDYSLRWNDIATRVFPEILRCAQNVRWEVMNCGISEEWYEGS